MTPLILLAALLAPAGVPLPASIAGNYQIETMEVGGGLELAKNGHFRFGLAYGAVDEEAEGEWSTDGKTVRLTSKPMPNAPAFELVADDPAPRGELWLTVDWQDLDWTGRVDAIATDPAGARGLVTTNEDGRVDSGGHILAAIDPMVPVFGIPAGHFALSQERGHRLRLKFHANDLGHAAFQSEPLEIRGKDLIMKRYDTEIRFVRIRP